MEKQIRILDTDLVVSPIGLGTVKAGLAWDGKEADRVIDAYLSMGGNVIDSARIYSDWVPPEVGRSERVIGDWIQREKRRNEVVLITKGGHPRLGEMHSPRMNAKDMRNDLELSLKTLHVEEIDIYLYHRDDGNQTVEEEIEVMEDFRREGKIRYYGCSNWTAERMREADRYCREKGYRGFVADEALMNLGSMHMKPLADDTLVSMKGDVLTYHKENLQNLAVPYTSVAGGFFHRYLCEGQESAETSVYDTEENIKIAEKIKVLMENRQATVTQVLLGYLMVQEFPCLALYGPKNAEQVEEAMKTLDYSFSREDYL
jgi:aryl-alcohol dehydrogenase-like predicted oxidoreductase